MRVYLANSHDGITMAVFRHKEDAILFGNSNAEVKEVIEIRLEEGQPKINDFQPTYTIKEW